AEEGAAREAVVAAWSQGADKSPGDGAGRGIESQSGRDVCDHDITWRSRGVIRPRSRDLVAKKLVSRQEHLVGIRNDRVIGVVGEGELQKTLNGEVSIGGREINREAANRVGCSRDETFDRVQSQASAKAGGAYAGRGR